MNGGSSMAAYTLPYVKQRANGNLLYDSGNSTQGSNNLEGWDRVGGWREIQERGDKKKKREGTYVHLC